MEIDKNITLSENQLRKIIKESILEVLSNGTMMNNFINVSNIPQYIEEDFRRIYHSPTFDNPLTIYMVNNNINEGLLLTYPIDKTINYIRDYFNLAPSQIQKINVLIVLKKLIFHLFKKKLKKFIL